MFLVLIFYFPSFIFAHIGYSTQSYCLDQIQTGILSLGCPTNQLIKLGRIIYGYSWSNDCLYIDKDCTMDIPRDDIICLTTTNCTIRVVEHPLILQDCWNLAATYVQAEYECIQDYSIQNMCQSQDIISSNGFLSTPNYPNGFISNLNCPCTLIPLPNHSIILEIIDFNLPICTESGLILWLGQEFQTKCLKQDPVTLISNTQQNITLRFYSLKSNKQGGILMKYSVSPESNNATIRLQCYTTSTIINRSTISNSLLKSKSSSQIQNIINHEDVVELPITNSNELSKQFRSAASIIEAHKDVLKQQQQSFQSLNQSAYKKQSSNLPRSNMTLIIIFIITIIIFLIIINILIWFMCSLRPSSSKSTSSIQNLYSQHINLNNKPKPSIYQQTHRLKTLHSLLYADHKPNDIEPIRTNAIRHFDSVLSEYHLPSNSSSANLEHGFIIKSKTNKKLHEPRQINSWDDI